MQYVMFKTYPKTSGGHKRKKIAQSFVKMCTALQIGHWKAVAGLPGPPLAGDQATMARLCSSSSLCSGSTEQGI